MKSSLSKEECSNLNHFVETSMILFFTEIFLNLELKQEIWKRSYLRGKGIVKSIQNISSLVG